MKGVILAGGLGTRLRPLSQLCPKPAMPVRGIPLIAYQLALLAHNGVSEVMINTHHLSELLIEAAKDNCPAGMTLQFSVEKTLLDTGGGLRRVAGFLRESDPCLILGGRLLLNNDLTALVRRHREREAAATLLLLDDPRSSEFGSIGVDAEGCVRRIGKRFDLQGEVRSGLYTWANVFAARVFDTLPKREVFSHFDDWLAPLLLSGSREILGEIANPRECSWTPVGTLGEYLSANLEPPGLSYYDADVVARERGVRIQENVVLGAGARIDAGASLDRVVVWSGESVGPLSARDGVFAGGSFHPCPTTDHSTVNGPGAMQSSIELSEK